MLQLSYSVTSQHVSPQNVQLEMYVLQLHYTQTDPTELAILSILRSGKCVGALSAFAYQTEVVSYVALPACLTVGGALFAVDMSRSLGAVTMFSTVHARIARVRGLSGLGLGLWFLCAVFG